MTIQQLEQGLLFDSNMFVIIGSKSTALIDTGTGFASDVTIKALTKVLNGRSLDIVILTHRHYDHVGGLGNIVEAFHPKVYAGKLDAVPIRDGDSDSTLGTKFGGHIEPTEVTDFNEGDEIDLGGHILTPYDSPGHTIGSIVVLDKVTRSLFSGDTFFVDGVGNYTHPTGSGEMLLQSLEKLEGLDFDALYPGHGPAVRSGGKQYIGKAITIMKGMR